MLLLCAALIIGINEGEGCQYRPAQQPVALAVAKISI